MTNRMPAVFMGHGSPTLALDNNEFTRGLAQVGRQIVARHGKPKAALVVSAHWFTNGWLVQTDPKPEQVYDMYGFPQELYDFKYPVDGSPELAQRVLDLTGADFGTKADSPTTWGIDHGTWTTLCHVFPQADVPLVQLSVNRQADAAQSYQMGKRLAALRDEGYLLLASGNVVHNLYRVTWNMPADGYDWAKNFNATVRDAVLARDDDRVVNAAKLPNYKKAAPTPEHFLPLVYMLGASQGERPQVFNDSLDLGSIAMTGLAFGM